MQCAIAACVLAGLAAPAHATAYVYLNRCTGGCVVRGGADDASAQTSSVIGTGTWTVEAFDGMDPEWTQIVQCVQAKYSPYDVVVTDQLADVPSGAAYTEAIIAGQPSDVGLSNDFIVIAPNVCSAIDGGVSFTFANAFLAQDRATNVCEAAAIEMAHVFGLSDVDGTLVQPSPVFGTSACMELMAIGGLCGPRFFRDGAVTCSQCCAATQSSHARLLALLGAGSSTVAGTATIVFPAEGATLGEGEPVFAQAGSQRGIVRVELWLNGYRWTSIDGAPFGTDGQPDPAMYTLAVPAAVPDSILDIVVKAFDDLGVEADSATVTVTKGAPCTDASMCAVGQTCDAGRCEWPPPTGELGEACTYDQFCVSSLCVDDRCAQTCTPGVTGACPAGFTCSDSGACAPPSAGGGGCSTGGSSSWLLALLALLFYRRRRFDANT